MFAAMYPIPAWVVFATIFMVGVAVAFGSRWTSGDKYQTID